MLFVINDYNSQTVLILVMEVFTYISEFVNILPYLSKIFS